MELFVLVFSFFIEVQSLIFTVYREVGISSPVFPYGSPRTVSNGCFIKESDWTVLVYYISLKLPPLVLNITSVKDVP